MEWHLALTRKEKARVNAVLNWNPPQESDSTANMKKALLIETVNANKKTRSAVDSLQTFLERNGFSVFYFSDEKGAKEFLCRHEVALVVIIDEVDPDLNGDRFVLYCHNEIQPAPTVIAAQTGSKPYIERMYNTDRYYEVSAMGYFATMDLRIPLSSHEQTTLGKLLNYAPSLRPVE